MLQPGSTLGRYEIQSQLGAGGMGEVYLARDSRLDRKVALKILPAAVAADPDRMRRFEQEAKAASALNHPNIITIYEVDRSGSTSFIAAEFIEGSTLRERIRAASMPVAEVLDVAVQVAGALAAAHASGIVHRDIKPDNIIVRGDGIAKVLDFGLAKVTGQESPELLGADAPTRAQPRTAVGLLMGTASYMSPEQARGDAIDARTDIFSLGIVLYEVLTGHLPFGGSNIYETIAAILSERAAPTLSRYAADMPAELERIVGKALRKDREERYQTTRDLLLDLQSLRQRLIFERTQSPSRPRVDDVAAAGDEQVRRMLFRVAAIVCALVLVAAALAYAWWKHADASTSPEIRSLAVLPLASLDAGEKYLGLGIADATIRRVSQTGKVIVRPTSAVRRYADEDVDALAAAKQLGVDSVLEGSLQRAGDRLRVSVNLLRCRDGVSLWSDNFDIRMADIFTVQDTVAQQVASRLRLQLDDSQQAQLTKRYTSSAVAYDYYLKGAYNFDQRMREPAQMLEGTVSFYRKAIEADPNFALAHAQLAYAYAVLAVFIEPTQPAWVARAQEEINRAEELDPLLADTHLARFQLLYSQFKGYQGEAAVRELQLANRLNPNVGHSELTYMYLHLGLEELAGRELARTREIDPTSDALTQTTLLMYEVESRYDAYAADRSVPHEGRAEAWYQIGKGRLADAERAIDAWAAKQPDNISVPPTRALLLASRGDFHAAEMKIPGILRLHPSKDPLYHHAAYDIACIYALEGKSVEAVRWLKESAAAGYHLYPRYARDAFLDPIRQSPEFNQFLSGMKAEHDRYQHEFS